MFNILHKVGIEHTSQGSVYRALSTIEGLSGWWTETTQDDPKVGGIIQFRFDAGGINMRVRELERYRRVVWEVAEGPREWQGTTVSFDLQQKEGWTMVYFKHEGWTEAAEFMHHCSTKWAIFLLSLKSMMEEGHGRPFPNAIRIDSWE